MRWTILIIHLAAALAPFIHSEPPLNTDHAERFPGWPVEFEGHPLEALPMTAQERGYNRGFPGKIGRFSDGQRELIIRYITRASRQLHPSADCLKGSGFKVTPAPIKVDQHGRYWGCQWAIRHGKRFKVCEQIHDLAGNSWYDVSSWYWAALLGRTQGGWWAVTVAEAI